MKVVHCMKDKYDVYIGRPSIWGNPFSHKDGTLAKFKCETREEAVNEYRYWLREQKDLLEKLPELEGKTLGCWCKPQSCHGDVLIEMIEQLKDEEKFNNI